MGDAMTETTRKPAKPKTVAKVGGVIHDGKGGYFEEGAALPDLPADTAASLKAKGLI